MAGKAFSRSSRPGLDPAGLPAGPLLVEVPGLGGEVMEEKALGGDGKVEVAVVVERCVCGDDVLVFCSVPTVELMLEHETLLQSSGGVVSYRLGGWTSAYKAI